MFQKTFYPRNDTCLSHEAFSQKKNRALTLFILFLPDVFVYIEVACDVHDREKS